MFSMTRLYLPLILAALQFISHADAAANCPLLGPVYPRPTDLLNSPIMQAAFANMTAQIDAVAAAAQGQQNSFSLEIFSTNTNTSEYTYHHTAPNLPTFNSTGVEKVDGNSVYRLGSLTKLFTIYTFLIQSGDIHWNTPITTYVPELKAIAAAQTGDATVKVSWNDITIGALASHMAGIAADSSLVGELTQEITSQQALSYMGFPPIPKADIPTCGTYPECTRSQFFSTFSRMQPALAPFSTAAYSNVAYQILGYALQTITGKTFESMLTSSVLTPLGLSNTFYNAPTETRGIIPGTVKSTNWYYSLGEENPAGNMYSSSSDIAKLGRAILSYRLLSGSQTRRWMKPMELDTDIKAAIGAPWGIRRILLDQKYRIVDTYDKGGQISVWTSFFLLVPDYNVGMVVLVAGNDLAGLQLELIQFFGDTVIPALEATAKAQAGEQYAGEYAFSAPNFGPNEELKARATPGEDNFIIGNGTQNGAIANLNATANATVHDAAAPLNSSMTVVIDDKPGLGVTRWISNGTDMRLTVAQLMTNYSDPYWVDLSIRLYPTDLIVDTAGSKKQSFKAIFEDLNAALVDATFYTACASWIGPTAYVYGGLSLDQFFFTTFSNGTVTLQPQALRATLKKIS
ncbi:Beta-lactamase-like protein sdnR [Lachnellula suecica]|uniref:Beta-lactamase-like protein sdnR n=1 Tax=Lachnellula suecica TaxID=602035 RepID=A0A8T9BX02_9HELO|nr:Beta-lactamase-like protein sdnR [Lachnellula suecica]